MTLYSSAGSRGKFVFMPYVEMMEQDFLDTFMEHGDVTTTFHWTPCNMTVSEQAV